MQKPKLKSVQERGEGLIRKRIYDDLGLDSATDDDLVSIIRRQLFVNDNFRSVITNVIIDQERKRLCKN